MDSPHYWVQYAMCRLSFSDYNRAQNYLTNAYQKAETKKEVIILITLTLNRLVYI